MTELDLNLPEIGPSQLSLLERLCNAAGVSGYETEVRRIVLEQVREIGAEARVDALGNVLVLRPGQGGPPGARRPRVMVAAHMDEVGLMLVDDEGGGIYRFEIVGGISPSQLGGKALWVGPEHLPGVIGMPPVHFHRGSLPDPLTVDDLRLDVGPEHAGQVSIGECAVFATPFTRLGPSLRAKALDDRLGVASLIELVRNPPPNIDLLAAFTVQEEIGLRGAAVAAFSLDPDWALVLDCTPAADLPAAGNGYLDEPPENEQYNTCLGFGPAIYVADRATLSDPRLVRLLTDTAEARSIPFQLRQTGGGGTDAGAIHTARAGIPSVSLSVPGRYIHTPAAIARLEDWQNTLGLAYAALSAASAQTLAGER